MPFANLDAVARPWSQAIVPGSVRAVGGRGRVVSAWSSLVIEPPPSWGWLLRSRGLMPWHACPHAAQRADQRGLPYAGVGHDIVDAVADAAFAVRVAGDDDPLHDVVRACAVGADLRAIVAGWPTWALRTYVVAARRGDRREHRSGLPLVGVADWRFPGGCVVAPRFTHTLELTSAWAIDEHGEPHLVGLVSGRRGRGRAWTYACVVDDVGHVVAGSAFDDAAIERARGAVEAASRVGYRGPIAVDAFVYAHPDGGRATLRGVAAVQPSFSYVHVALGSLARAHPGSGARAECSFDRDDVVRVELRGEGT